MCSICSCRFQKNDILRLGLALNLPAEYKCKNGTSATGAEALLIMLRRLTYPNRWCDLVSLFGRAEPELSVIFNTVCCNVLSLLICVLIFHQIVSDIYDRFSHLLQSLNLVWLDCEVFAAAIEAKGAPLHQCWGFIDGTVRPIARPVRNQRIMYSGHKRIHCLKFQVNYNVNNNNNYFIMFYSQWKRPMV